LSTLDENGKAIGKRIETVNPEKALRLDEELGLPIIDKAKFKALTKELGIKSNLKEYKGFYD
jgi:hypothetical protein